MEGTYLDFRYLQFRKTPSSAKCALISLVSGIALSLPYILQILLGSTSYVKFQSYRDISGLIKCNFWLENPYGLDFFRYVNYGFNVLLPDLVIFFVAVLLWTFFMSLLINETKKQWQIYPLTMTFGFTIPVLLFTISIFTGSEVLQGIAKLVSQPIAIYLLLSFALGIVFGKKKIIYFLLLGLFGYFLGYLLLSYVANQITNSQFEKAVPIEKLANWLSLVQIAKNLIWNFFIGIGVYIAYGDVRKLSGSFARFEET
jgi:hypothetical protein